MTDNTRVPITSCGEWNMKPRCL